MRGTESGNAYLTLYLALSMTMILSVLLTLIEGARMNAIRMQIECVTDIAMNSVLAEFHRALHEQYDLFFVDTSYGGAVPSQETMKAHLEEYMEKNYSAQGVFSFGDRRDFTALSVDSLEITGARYAPDRQAKALREQIYAYMAADPAGAVVGKVLTQLDTFEGLTLSNGSWRQERDGNERTLKETEPPTTEDAEGNQVEVPINNPADAVSSFRQRAVLAQIFGGEGGLSGAALERENVLSGREYTEAEEWEAGNTHNYPEADALLFDQYVFEKCGSYRNQLEKSHLKYQVEYLIFGKESDRQNLADMASALLVCREAANCLYLFSDAGRCAEADAMAAALSAVILLPELQPLIKVSILFAWAYLESVQDVKTLFAGGKVPLLKSAESWRTGIRGIFTPDTATQAQEDGEGLDYEMYLRMMLYLQSGALKNIRLMDMMESDIRRTAGNAQFRMDGCLDSYGARAQVSSGFGYSYTIERTISYN